MGLNDGIQHTRIILATNFQLNQAVLIAWTELEQKGFCHSETEKVNSTIDFTIFELEITQAWPY